MAAQMTASKIEGLEEPMIKVLQALRDTRAAIASLPKEKEIIQVTDTICLGRDELLNVLERRVETFEARARELGIFGPATKVEPGQSTLIAHAKGGANVVAG